MKKLLLSIVCLCLFNVSVFADDDKPTTVAQMPQAAQQFISKYFSGKKVSLAKVEIVKSVKSKYPDAKIIQIERDNRHYDVDLSNGWELKYNKQFKLVDIEK